ncbi:hypothetical protein ABBQ38_003770 [Trebouxia sp. C0009 RCD-2024]
MTTSCAQVGIITAHRPRITTAGLVPFTSKSGRTVAPSRGSKRNVQTPAWFNFGKPKALEEKVKRETVIPEPSYSIPIALTGITGLSAVEGNLILAGITGFLAAFLAFQASRVQFVFDDEALEVLIKSNESENSFVGGRNRWEYDSFTNWEFWWTKFPVLVYFKETQTKPEGQIHFFPVLFKGNQLYDVMAERCGSSQNSAPAGPAEVED